MFWLNDLTKRSLIRWENLFDMLLLLVVVLFILFQFEYQFCFIERRSLSVVLYLFMCIVSFLYTIQHTLNSNNFFFLIYNESRVQYSQSQNRNKNNNNKFVCWFVFFFNSFIRVFLKLFIILRERDFNLDSIHLKKPKRRSNSM